MARRDHHSTEGLSTADVRTVSRLPVPTLPEMPVLTILWHPNVRRIGERVALGELLRGRTAEVSRRMPEFTPPGGFPGRPLEDSRISRGPIRFRPGPSGSVGIEVTGSRTRVVAEGTAIKDEREFTAEQVLAGIVLELAESVVLLLHRGRPEAGKGEEFGIVGAGPGIERLRAAIREAADLDLPVLLRGETGTGKELAARALHQGGNRRSGPFVAVNLGALPPSLAAAELFGTKKGAYTGATHDQEGFFVRADGGTLFLDEIGEAPPEIQVMLLRALETGEILPVGERTPRSVDVRIVAATDAELDRLIDGGGFRAPLYHRLAGYEIRLPALRERREDLGRLLVFFLERTSRELGVPQSDDKETPWPWLTAPQIGRLARFHWPGNVRQLQNTARRLAIIGRRGISEATVEVTRLLDEWIGPPTSTSPRHENAAPSMAGRGKARPAKAVHRPTDDVDEEELLEALRAHRFRLKPTAEHLGVSRTSLYALIDRSPNVRRAGDVGKDELESSRERHGNDLEAMAEELEISSHGLLQRLRELKLA